MTTTTLVEFLPIMNDNNQIKLMQKRRLWRYLKPMLLAGFIVIGGSGTALAITSSSDTYKMTEGKFGAGSTLQSCSDQYCAKASIGDLAASSSSVGGGTATFDPIEGNDPRLEVIIDPGVSNLGVLTAETTATKTSVVRINNYLVGGYTLQIVGDPPKFGTHTLATLSSPTASAPGTEQFGINAVSNTAPNVGTDPAQLPSGVATFGVVDGAYNTPNLFKYASEGVVARSSAKSGRTDYTISMIVNISNATPAGHYAGDFAVVVIPAY
jgi:hypothetical protein